MKTLKITILCTLLNLFGFSQTIHTVDNRDQSGAQFTDLQTAINAASTGDIIQVHPSPNSYESITIDKTLTIMGLGHNSDVTGGEIASLNTITFINNSAGSQIKGLSINNIKCGTSSTSPDQTNMHIINNHIRSNVTGSTTDNLSDGWIIEGNYFSSTSTNVNAQNGTSNWQIKNNFLRGSITNLNNTSIVTNNIFLTTLSTETFFSYCSNPLVNNNIFLSTGTLTEIGIYSSTITFVSNITYSYYGATISPLSGSNNLDNTNPLFENVPMESVTDFYSNDFNLDSGSPGINAGSDGTDIGLYGNNFAFDPNGRPNLTPYAESITITNSVVAPGQTLNVDFTATQKQ
ncbi:right-handed parallel beta-helix repeat-containing protein [Winogradskyella sp. PC D3.3]